MKKMKYVIFSVMTILMVASCVVEINNTAYEEQELKFNASFASGDATKTILIDGKEVHWLPGDYISVSGASEPFVSDATEQTAVTNFSGSAIPADEYFAVYPYASVDSWNDNVATVMVQYNQTPVAGTFATNLNISAAHTSKDDMKLSFHNVLGYLKFTIDENSGTLRSVEVATNGRETISGMAEIVFDQQSGLPSLIPKTQTNTVMLYSGYPFEPGDYYIAMIPGVYKDGLTLTFTDINGRIAERIIGSELKLEAGKIKNIGTVRGLEFETIDEIHAKEKEALIALYDALDGDNWTNNTNWCSDRPVNEWYGVSTNHTGHVSQLYFMFNNLSGEIPVEIKNLKKLESFVCCYEDIHGSIPDELWELSNLESLVIEGNIQYEGLTGVLSEKVGGMRNLRRLSLSDNKLSGIIPDVWSNLGNLEVLFLGGNQFTGPIPESMGTLTNLTDFNIGSNGLSGKVPESLMSLPVWKSSWLYGVLVQNAELGGGISSDGLMIPAPTNRLMNIDGEYIDGQYFYDNEYTIIFGFLDGCPFSDIFIPELVKLYKKYKDKGLEIVSVSQLAGMSEEAMRRYISQFDMSWKHHILVGHDGVDDREYTCYAVGSPTVAVVNKVGYLEFIPTVDDRKDLAQFLAEKLGPVEGDESRYESTDYSADSQVTVLQTASVGDGIDVVIMGDAYTDRLIADGTYDRDMNKAYTALFSVEPYKSFKDMFNVYYVNVVSQNEVYGEDGAQTALETHLGALEGGGLTQVWGNDAKVFEYASKAIAPDKMDEVTIVTLMNVKTYAGTCYMYAPENPGDWGNGPSISYLPLGPYDETLEQLIHHETLGHGFAKLADEYFNGYESVDQSFVETISGVILRDGYYKNIDFTDDPSKVRWSKFLTDERYVGADIGVFEGAFGVYAYGIYRPSSTSIMDDNKGSFNAPSREAIYYRMHKLAYGPEWEYDYETFVEYDVVNRVPSATAMMCQSTNYVEEHIEPTSPPVIVNHIWNSER